MNQFSLILSVIVTLSFSFGTILSQQISEISIHKLHKKEFGSKEKIMSKFSVDGESIIPLQKNSSKELSKIVFGYLPDWEYIDGAAQYLRYDLLTHLAAFDFVVSNSGSISNPSGWPWTDLINDAHAAGTKVILTAVNFDEDDIRKIITDSVVTQTFFTNVRNKIETYNLDGVNIDFEGLYNADKGVVINTFMSKLTEYIHTELPGKEVSFAGPAVNWGNYWDLDGLVQSCDYVFIMGYAFWGGFSNTSGPNAPLVGFTHDITSTVTQEYGVPVSKYPEKVILGVPYYGHKWQTVTNAAYSSTVESIGSWRYRVAQPESEIYGLFWDSKSQTPWYRYQNDDWFQAWFDDVQSLDKKYTLADNNSLGGIGMWALGYDGNLQDLWNLLDVRYGEGSLPIPNSPRSFRVIQENENTLLLQFEVSDWADRYGVYLSRDGLNFDRITESASTTIPITNLTPDSVYYFKVDAVNDSGISYPTEVLGGIPSNNESDILIVNGFERTSNTNNTFDYIRMYGEPAMQINTNFSSTSNDAVYKGFVDLTDYHIVIWSLLDESTADETFNSIEQSKVADFLENGGKLFVSGSEIGWDLVEKGSDADKAFYRDYLKARYISDAPNNQSGTYYTAIPSSFGIFDGLGDITFDNGNHGTIDVDWPDAIAHIDDQVYVISTYKGIADTSKGFSGIRHQGPYYGDSGPSEGMLVYLAYPFESIYPQQQRNNVLSRIYNWFTVFPNVEKSQIIPTQFNLNQNYPNPFNPNTTIKYAIPSSKDITANYVSLKVFDVLGREVATIVNEQQQPGNYEVVFNASQLSSGTYFYRLTAGNFSKTMKMILLK